MLRSRSPNTLRPAVGLLMVVEGAVLAASMYAAVAIDFNGSFSQFAEQYGQILPTAFFFTSAMLLALFSLGMYQLSQRLYFKEAVARLLAAFVIGGVAIAALWFMLPAIAVPRIVAATAASLSLAGLAGVRYLYLRRVDHNLLRRRSLVYGSAEMLRPITRLRRRSDRRGFQIVGLVQAKGEPKKQRDLYVTAHDRPLLDIARELRASEIVIAMDQRRGVLPVAELLDARLKGIEVVELAKFMERESRKIYIDLIRPSWIVFSDGFRNDIIRRVVKRVFDTAVASIALLMALPVIVLTALAIKLEEGFRAPVFYRQVRVGVHGENFKLVKFRSMRVDAEADGEARWAEVDDPRMTRVGRWLRKWRIDEVPQLYNVLKGQMSIVGPRPERPDFVSQLAEVITYYNERHVVKPGITGWAQLRYQYGSSVHDALEKLQYDLYYVKNQSLILDLVIVLQTIEVILWGKGAR